MDIPKGWKLVPEQATFAMHNAAAHHYVQPQIKADHDGVLRLAFSAPDWTRAYEHMLAAAPTYQPPAAPMPSKEEK